MLLRMTCIQASASSPVWHLTTNISPGLVSVKLSGSSAPLKREKEDDDD